MPSRRQELFVAGTSPELRINCDVVRFGDLLFLSEIGPIDHEGKLVGADDILAQTAQVMRNMWGEKNADNAAVR